MKKKRKEIYHFGAIGEDGTVSVWEELEHGSYVLTRKLKRIRLPRDIYEVTDQGVWVRVKRCTLPEFVEGQARQTHKMVDGSICRLITWEKVKEPFFKTAFNDVLKRLWRK